MITGEISYETKSVSYLFTDIKRTTPKKHHSLKGCLIFSAFLKIMSYRKLIAPLTQICGADSLCLYLQGAWLAIPVNPPNLSSPIPAKITQHLQQHNNST